MHMPEKMILGLVEDLLMNSISVLKDEGYQRKVWFRQESADVNSYSDATLHLIAGCETLFKYPTCADYLGRETYELLKKLYDLVLKHYRLTENRIDPDILQESELLNDPNWHTIQTLAEELDIKLTEFVERKNYESNKG